MKTLDTIEVDISVELGATVMPIHHLLRMGRGAVIELDTTEQDPLRVYANSTLVARGETCGCLSEAFGPLLSAGPASAELPNSPWAMSALNATAPKPLAPRCSSSRRLSRKVFE